MFGLGTLLCYYRSMAIEKGKHIFITGASHIDVPEIKDVVGRVEKTLGTDRLMPLVINERVIAHRIAVSSRSLRKEKIVGVAAITEPNPLFRDIWAGEIATTPEQSQRIFQLGLTVVDQCYSRRSIGTDLLKDQLEIIREYYEATPVAAVLDTNTSAINGFLEQGGLEMVSSLPSEVGRVSLFVFNQPSVSPESPIA